MANKPTLKPETTETTPAETAPAATEAVAEPTAIQEVTPVVVQSYVPTVSKFPPPTESAELIAATKADAEARGKEFHKCPVTGVLVVS